MIWPDGLCRLAVRTLFKPSASLKNGQLVPGWISYRGLFQKLMEQLLLHGIFFFETTILMSKKAGLFMVEKEMVYPVGICSDPRRHFGTASEKADLKKKRKSGWLLVVVGCIFLFLPWVLTCRNGRIPLVLSRILVIPKLPLLDWYDWCMIMTSLCWFDLQE